MIKLTVMAVSILLIAMVLWGCRNGADDTKKKPAAPTVTEPPLPSATLGRVKELQVKVAEEFVILADGNITTGFAWYYCGKETVDGVELKKNDYIDPKTNGITCGAPGMFQFVFEAKKAGRYELKFEYKRPWEKDVEPMVEKILIVVD